MADDLTGAADTGVQFTRHRVPARVWLSDGALEPGATVFDTDSRSLAPGAAAQRVGSLGARLATADLVYKKVDSTMRGNVGAEVEALMRGLSVRAAVLAPAFPANGRTTLGGVQRVAGVPVHETAMARDPAHPMRHATIVAALREQSDLEVVTVSLGMVRHGADPLALLLRDLTRATGPTLAVVDAESDDDLAMIARAVSSVGTICLPVGSAGLAGALARTWESASWEQALVAVQARPRVRAERVLVVCGSLNPTSRGQVDALWAHGLTALVSDPRASDPVVVARELAAAAVASVDGARPDALVLTGGDTARAVLAALGGRGLALESEILPGVPLGRVIGGRLDGTTVVTKAGGFGGPDTLVRVHRFLQESRQ